MIEKYFLNTRGQVETSIIAVAVFLCQIFSFVLYFIQYRIEVVPIALLLSFLFAGAHMLFLGLFNYFFRHPILRYTLLVIAFELLLFAVLMLLWLLYQNNNRFSFNRFFEDYLRAHLAWEAWYFIIIPSLSVIVLAIFIEFKADKYHLVEVPQNKTDSNILDDIL